jgi:osmotically-inducible protein OsmY
VWSIGGSPREQPAAGQAGSGVHAGKGPRGYCRGDVRLYDEVCDKLERDGDLDASDIEVTVKEGEVVLAGSVCDETARHRAEAVAAGCTGVREVRNRLRCG